MNRPALVLFDLDEVLAEYRHPPRIARLAQDTGTTPEAVNAALFESGLEAAADRGELDGPQTLAELSRRLGAEVTLEHWISARRVAMKAHEPVLALAHAIARHARVAILSNNGLLLREHLQAMCPPLFPLFADAVFVSAQFRRGKPDPQVYLDCLAELGVTAAEALFVDDKAANAEGARAAGLPAHHFTGADGLAATLRAHHLLEPSP
jgi:putative hydrolase of the HAD superfamily